MNIEEKQLDARTKILKLVKKAPDFTSFVIDDKQVSRATYVKALEAEGAHKLPFAYSKRTITFYLLTRKRIAESKER